MAKKVPVATKLGNTNPKKWEMGKADKRMKPIVADSAAQV
jgi:hypothetical protein